MINQQVHAQARDQEQTGADARAQSMLTSPASQAQSQTGATQMITTKTGKILDPQQMHVCRLCDKLLSSSSSLDRHMLTHSGERPFVCKRCHMTFTTNGNMHRHMRTHLHKDSLARQQQEQLQLKQGLLAGAGGPLASGAISSASPLQQQVANSISSHDHHHNHHHHDHHHHQQQQQQQQQRGIFSPVADVGPSPPVRPGLHQSQHFQAPQPGPQSALMSAPHMSAPHGQQAPLVGPLASLLGVAAAATTNSPAGGGGHMQALLNQHLVAAMFQQQQQQPAVRHAGNKHQLELNNLGIQTPEVAGAAQAFDGHHPPADISAQLFQNQQQVLAAAASQLAQQHQQRALPVAGLEQLDTKSLMMSAAMAAAAGQGGPQASLESVRAIMLAAAAAAAASKAMQQQQQRETPTSRSNASNNLLMELPLERQQHQQQWQRTDPPPARADDQRRLVRGKRRKQVNPLRSHCQQEDEEERAQRRQFGQEADELRDLEEGRRSSSLASEPANHSGASSLIEDLLAGCEREAAAAAAAGNERAPAAVKNERTSQSPLTREDFNNNDQRHPSAAAAARATSAAGQLVKALLLEEAATSAVAQRRPAEPRRGDSEAGESGDGASPASSSASPGGTVRVATSADSANAPAVKKGADILDHEFVTDIEDDSDSDQCADLDAICGSDNNNNNNSQEEGAKRTTEAHGRAMRSEQIISLNYTTTTNDSLDHQLDCLNTTNTSTSDDRRHSSSFVSSSREILDADDVHEDEEDEEEEEEEGEGDDSDRRSLVFDRAGSACGDVNPMSDMQQQQQQQQQPRPHDDDGDDDDDRDDDEERRDSRSGITQLGPGDEDDEVIEDISQSYVKTANPNATRKGGKRNRHCYKCKLCTYSSVDRCTLVRHLRIHSGERPYICGICRYAFTTKANCERHVRKRHKKQYNSLGGSGGVKGSNGGGRSLIITDHSNHQTIPVKVNPVAAETISQTLRRIQEKEQQQQQQQRQQLGGHREIELPTGSIGGPDEHRGAMLDDENGDDNNIERINGGRGGASNTGGHNGKGNLVHTGGNKPATNGKRKHRSGENHSQDNMPAQQRRRLAGKQQQLSDHLPALSMLGFMPPKDLFGATVGPNHEMDLALSAANFSGATAPLGGPERESSSSTSELFANLLAQIQQMTSNNNNNNSVSDNNNHPATTSTSKQQHQQQTTQMTDTPGESPVSNATLLANMLAAGKAMTASETSQPAPATAGQLNSLLSTKHLSHQFAQLRNLNLQNPFFNRLNPLEPFSSLDLAAQALDLSCSNQPRQK